MLVVDDRWLKKGQRCSAPDLPVPVVRAVREWGSPSPRAQPAALGNCPAPTAETKATQVVALLEAGAINAADTERVAARVRSFEVELHSQSLTPIQPGILRIRRHEIPLRDAGQPRLAVAPQELIRSAEARWPGARARSARAGRARELAGWATVKSGPASRPGSRLTLTAASMSDRKFPAFVAQSDRVGGIRPQGLLALEVQHEASPARRAPVRQVRRTA